MRDSKALPSRMSARTSPLPFPLFLPVSPSLRRQVIRRLRVELREIDAGRSSLRFEDCQPILDPLESQFDLRIEQRTCAGWFGARDAGIPELPLQRGEHVERVLAAVGL